MDGRDWIYPKKMDHVSNACQNVIAPRAISDEYFRYFWKCDFLTVRDIFEEIRSKYVNYSNIGGALCQLRDIRQSAESYRINMKKKKKKRKRWYGKRWRKRNEDLFAGSLDYSSRETRSRRCCIPLNFRIKVGKNRLLD